MSSSPSTATAAAPTAPAASIATATATATVQGSKMTANSSSNNLVGSGSGTTTVGAPSTSMLSVLSAIFQENSQSGANAAQTKPASHPIVDLEAALPKEALSGEHLLKSLEQIVKSAKASKDQAGAKLSPLKSLSLTVASLSNYLNYGLTPSQLRLVASSVADSSSRWLKDLLKLTKHSQVAFTKGEDEGRILAVRAALLRAFPSLLTEGFVAIKQSPVIYTSLPSLFDEQVLAKLGLGSNNIRQALPSELEELIQKDRADGRLPLFVDGVLCPERTDDVASLRQICKRHKLWLHIEGDDVGLLLAGITFRAILSADSFSLAIGRTLGLAFKSAAVFFRETLSSALYDVSAALPYGIAIWAGLLFVGSETLVKSVSKAAEFSKDLATRLSVAQGISVKHPGVSLSTLFRYAPRTVEDDAGDFQDVFFLNNLNKQLLIDLHETATPLGLDVHSLGEANFLRFQPLSLQNLSELNRQTIGNFVANLKKLTELINLTISSRSAFRKAVENIDGLTNVRVTNFVGLGAVRFTPKYLQAATLAPEVRAEIDQLNRTLAEKLAQTDALFSQGTTVDGDVCICLGVESKPLGGDAPQLYAQKIAEAISNSEADRKIVENIGELVKKSIEEAEEQLRRETEEAYYQRSIIGRVPVVGSVWNWYWDTPEPETTGRSFELASKSMKTTELRKSQSSLTNSTDRTLSANPSPSASVPILASPTPTSTSETPVPSTEEQPQPQAEAEAETKTEPETEPKAEAETKTEPKEEAEQQPSSSSPKE